MLSVEQVRQLPKDLNLVLGSQKEYEQSTPETRERLLRVSPHVWRVDRNGEPLLVAGIFIPMLVGSTPEMWLLVCEGMKRRLRRNASDIRQLIRALLKIYPHLIVRVDADYPTGQRFAEFMGFKRLQGTSRFNEREYLVYEIRDGK